MITLSMDRAIGILGVLGCSEDLIFWYGGGPAIRYSGDLTPARLGRLITDRCAGKAKPTAGHLKIQYYGGKGRRPRLITGSLADMVRDRLGLAKRS